MKVSIERWWDDTDREKPNYPEKTLSQCKFLHHEPQMASFRIERSQSRCETGD
jgi:hypothetical protein